MVWTVEMSERELKRVSLVAQVQDSSPTTQQAANVLELSLSRDSDWINC